MKIILPDSCKAFCCTGSGCGDNCCIGWEIDIDPKAAALYKAEPGPLGDRLRANIQWDDPPYFRLSPDERCPFLNGDNLCEIIITLGEKALCEICDRHPRFFHFLPGRLEIGLGLCCEEAARLTLCKKEKAFLTDWEGPADRWNAEEGDWSAEDQAFCATLLESRETAFFIVQNRHLPLWKRAALLLLYGEEIQDWLDNGEGGNPALCFQDAAFLKEKGRCFPQSSLPSGEKAAFFQQTGQLYLELERLDGSWTAELLSLGQELPPETEGAFWRQGGESLSFAYEQLLWYYLYRYWTEAMADGDLKSRIVFGVMSFLLLVRLGQLYFQKSGSFSAEELAVLARRYAKEVEYSPENLEALADAAWQAAFLKTENLLRILCSETGEHGE